MGVETLGVVKVGAASCEESVAFEVLQISGLGVYVLSEVASFLEDTILFLAASGMSRNCIMVNVDLY